MMKFFKSKSKLSRRQRGLTLIEVGGAIAGGIIFLALATFGVLRALDNNRYSTLNRMIGNDMAGAVLNIYSTAGTLTSLTTAAGKNILVGMGVKGETPWNTLWTVQTAGTANTVVIRFPIGGAQAATKGPTLAPTLSGQYPIVSAATFATNNLDVTFNTIN